MTTMPQPINVPATDLNINLPSTNKFITANPLMWQILKVIGILAIIGIILILLVAFILWIIRLLRPAPSIQRNLISKKHKSCASTKRENIKKVYRYDENGIHFIGEYLGETTELLKDVPILHVLVGHPKIVPVSRVIHNFVFQCNFIYTLPKASVKTMLVNNEIALVLLAKTFEYNLNSKSYVASDHIGLPKAVNKVFLEDTEDEFNHEILNTIFTKLDKTIEMNPYVSARIKQKQEYEEENDNNE